MSLIERGYDHPRAALEHAIRDPAIAQHEGWRQDARSAVDEIERLRSQHARAIEVAVGLLAYAATHGPYGDRDPALIRAREALDRLGGQ